MAFLFDFGISQEDPLSEQRILDLQPTDRVLSLASGGEVPLSLMSLHDGIQITAVDMSEPQIKLCRLKLAAALHLYFPLNGQFLGYAGMKRSERNKLFHTVIRPVLTDSDVRYWDENLDYIEKGIINAGRFEQYINKLRLVASLFIGQRNLRQLISCQTVEEQARVFDRDIATRRSLQLLFKIAFHPAIYRKRGLQEQALIHAGKSTGERFYSKFRDFCTATLASENYFLQYFLTGKCITPASYPIYLQPISTERLRKNQEQLTLITTTFQNVLIEKGNGYFNKIHQSNLGDWLDEKQFADLLGLLREYCLPGTVICARYLQKNQFEASGTGGFPIDRLKSDLAEKTDRFPFYAIQPIIIQS